MRARTVALLGTTGLLTALLVSAPAAPAATINACQKKKGGTIRIVSSKTKCKKTEKKVKWSTTGAAGKNGSNGVNGSNGANGANGTAGPQGPQGPQGPGATRLAGELGSIGFLTDTTVAQATVAGVTIKLNCGNGFIFNASTIRVTSPVAGTMWTQTVYRENPADAIDEPQTASAFDSLAASVEETHNTGLAGGDANPNQATFLSVIDSGNTTIIVSGGTTVGTGCTVRATAVPAAS
jgi:hypothetical protein